ncbi:hypothetical protein W760_02641 [Staphylococcus aureus VET0787S]|nr:hypothetical protein U399_02515 [Staphylococcus aureus H57823]KAG25098.1 hypothetical protein W760_02641 [Staphylococcus aureus VET0787S]
MLRLKYEHHLVPEPIHIGFGTVL